MPNPYTSTTVSGYNASPPPDDETQVPTNAITWAGIKTKLGDPLNTFAGSVNSNITSAFGFVTPIILGADFPVTSSTALVDTGLDYNVPLNGTYSFEAYLTCTDAAAGGVQAAINFNGTASSIVYDGWVMDSNTIIGMTHVVAVNGAVCNVATTATTGLVLQIKGSIVVTGIGTLSVMFAQHSSNGTASTVKKGSWLKVI